jgi:hypothetical protein
MLTIEVMYSNDEKSLKLNETNLADKPFSIAVRVIENFLFPDLKKKSFFVTCKDDTNSTSKLISSDTEFCEAINVLSVDNFIRIYVTKIESNECLDKNLLTICTGEDLHAQRKLLSIPLPISVETPRVVSPTSIVENGQSPIIAAQNLFSHETNCCDDLQTSSSFINDMTQCTTWRPHCLDPVEQLVSYHPAQLPPCNFFPIGYGLPIPPPTSASVVCTSPMRSLYVAHNITSFVASPISVVAHQIFCDSPSRSVLLQKDDRSRQEQQQQQQQASVTPAPPRSNRTYDMRSARNTRYGNHYNRGAKQSPRRSPVCVSPPRKEVHNMHYRPKRVEVGVSSAKPATPATGEVSATTISGVTSAKTQ